MEYYRRVKMNPNSKSRSQLCPLCKKSWDRCKCDLEKDLGVKIGSPEAMAWKKIKMDSEETIKKSKRDIEILEIVEKHANKRMEEEIEKFK